MRRTVLVAVALLAAACGSDDRTTVSEPLPDRTSFSEPSPDAAAQTVTSNDGRLVIGAPPGLPTITVTTADFDESRLGPGLALVAAYEFGPDGAVFDPPVSVTLTLNESTEDGASPVFLLLESDDGWEVPPQRVEMGEGTLSVIAEVEHFSGGSYVRAEPAPDDSTPRRLPVVTDLELDPFSFTEAVGRQQAITGAFTVTVPGGKPESGSLKLGRDPGGLGAAADSRGVIEVLKGDPDQLEASVACIGEGTGQYQYDVSPEDLYVPLRADERMAFLVDGKEVEASLSDWSLTLTGFAHCEAVGSDLTWAEEPTDDCREGYGFESAPCGEGVEVTRYAVVLTDGVLELWMQLAGDPMISEETQWFADLFLQMDGASFGCGVSNVPESGPATSTLQPYVFDQQGTPDLETTPCTASLETNDRGPVAHLRLDAPAATGMPATPESFLAAGTFGSNADGSMASADDLFNSLDFVSETGLVRLGDLCDSGLQDRTCSE